jgi:hypothetical protein
MELTPNRYGIQLSGANSMTLKLLRIPSSKSCKMSKMRPRAEILSFLRKNLPFKARVADPHHFHAHSAPDPPFYFNANPGINVM